jgi:hypothetical protein
MQTLYGRSEGGLVVSFMKLDKDAISGGYPPQMEEGFSELWGREEQRFDTETSEGFIFEIVDIALWFLLDLAESASMQII